MKDNDPRTNHGSALLMIAHLNSDIANLKEALEKIATLNLSNDSTEGYNEWGEADCFKQAQAIAWDALTWDVLK
jgi:hypothetical protein